MASGSTTNYALPYPLDTDPVNVAGDVEDLAVTIDSILRESIDDASAALITGATVSNGFSTPVYTDNGSSVGSLAFSLAQDIRSTASPAFVGLSLSGTISSGTWGGTAIAADKGGTGQTSYAVGDLLYASTTTALSKLADIATGNALISGGVGVAPSWGKIGLTTHVSGTLPVANGGTGVTSSTGTTSVVLSGSPTLTGTPLSTTAAVDTNTTQIATTAFVIGQAYAKLASPTFTGTPAAPTAAVETNTTQVATTEYVVSQGYLKSATASSTYLALAGGTLTGALIATAPTTSLASLRLPHGTAPTSPTDGDTWTTTLGLYVQVDGVTVGPLGTGGGGTSGVGLDSVMFLGGM
jgi:hypothetical protein